MITRPQDLWEVAALLLGIVMLCIISLPLSLWCRLRARMERGQ